MFGRKMPKLFTGLTLVKKFQKWIWKCFSHSETIGAILDNGWNNFWKRIT